MDDPERLPRNSAIAAEEPIVFSLTYASGSDKYSLAKQTRPNIKKLLDKLQRLEAVPVTTRTLTSHDYIRGMVDKKETISKIAEKAPVKSSKPKYCYFEIDKGFRAFGCWHDSVVYITHIDPNHNFYN